MVWDAIQKAYNKNYRKKCGNCLAWILTVCYTNNTYTDKMLPLLYTTLDTQNHNGCQERSKAVFSLQSQSWLQQLEICLLLQKQAHHNYKSK